MFYITEYKPKRKKKKEKRGFGRIAEENREKDREGEGSITTNKWGFGRDEEEVGWLRLKVEGS